jgi:hypothetical protein
MPSVHGRTPFLVSHALKSQVVRTASEFFGGAQFPGSLGDRAMHEILLQGRARFWRPASDQQWDRSHNYFPFSLSLSDQVDHYAFGAEFPAPVPPSRVRPLVDVALASFGQYMGFFEHFVVPHTLYHMTQTISRTFLPDGELLLPRRTGRIHDPRVTPYQLWTRSPHGPLDYDRSAVFVLSKDRCVAGPISEHLVRLRSCMWEGSGLTRVVARYR